MPVAAGAPDRGGGRSGQSSREAARALRISEHTARQHLKAVFAKVGVHSRDHLREVLTGGLR